MKAWMEGRSARVTRTLLILGILGGAGALVFQRVNKRVDVTIDRAAEGQAVDAIYATGTVEAENRVRVKARTPGALVELPVHTGSVVKRGELLARIDSPVASFDAERGRAELRAAVAQSGKDAPRLESLAAQAKRLESDLTVARQDLARTQSLARAGALPGSELERAEARVSGLESALGANAAEQRALRVDLDAMRAQKSAQLDSLEARVTDAEVRSPIDGVVLVKHVELGEVVGVNQALFLVGDARSLILELDVDEADIARVRDGTDGSTGTRAAVSLLAFPNQVFEGHVFDVEPDADRTKKAFLVKVRLASPPPGLRSGMTAEVNLIVESHAGLLVPSSAESDGEVWVVKDGRAAKRKVKTGVRDPLRVEILEGLAAGEAVVVEGGDGLEPGARVNATERPLAIDTPMPDPAQRSRGSL
jgi:HlyD family secretion protein